MKVQGCSSDGCSSISDNAAWIALGAPRYSIAARAYQAFAQQKMPTYDQSVIVGFFLYIIRFF